jgi:hypothetical protein
MHVFGRETYEMSLAGVQAQNGKTRMRAKCHGDLWTL